MSQHKVPVPITRYMVNDKPSAERFFQILNACGKKAEVVSVAAKKPMYSGLSIFVMVLKRDSQKLFHNVLLLEMNHNTYAIMLSIFDILQIFEILSHDFSNLPS